MSFPLGYDESPLSPIIVIKDFDGIEQFRYETPQAVVGSPVQDFSLTSGILSKGINTNHGIMKFFIRDDDELLVDKDNPIHPLKIKQGWEVELFLGKDPSSVNLWYRGIINKITRLIQTKTITIEITTFGWGSLTASRYSSMNRTQEKLSDGLTSDTSDNTTKATELFKDVLQDTDHLAVPGLGLLDIIVNDIEDLPSQLGDYRKNLVTIGSELNELATMVGAYWGIDQNKNAFLRERNSQDSMFLITNDVKNPSLMTQNWDQERIAFTKGDQTLTRTDSSQESAFTIVHGVGSQRQIVDHFQISSNSLFDFSIENHAFPFFPEKDNISQISIALTRTAPITSGLTISVVGESKTIPGAPDSNDIREIKALTAALLEKELSAASNKRFIDIKFNKIPVTKGEKLFVIIEKTTNPALTLTIDQQDTQGKHFTSPDLTTWTEENGESKFISYQSKTVRIIGQNTEAQKLFRPKETVITLPDKPDERTVLQIFEAAIVSLSKIIMNFEPIKISTTTLPLELGKTIKYVDVDSGFERQLNLIGYDLQFNAFGESALGATEITITLQEIYL